MDQPNIPATDPEWVQKAQAELEGAEKQYEQEKLKEDLIMAISKMSHDQRVKLKEILGA